MDSIYYCFLCGAEFNTSEEWNAHLNVSFFYFSLLIYFLCLFKDFKTNVCIFCIDFFFIIFSHIFIAMVLLSNFCDMSELVQDMFILYMIEFV